MCQIFTITFASMYIHYKGKQITVVCSEYMCRDVYCPTLVRPSHLLFLSNIEKFRVIMSYQYKNIATP